MKGIINISGVIGRILNDDGKPIEPFIEFIDVVRQFESQKGLVEFDVNLNGPGGYTEEADDIYDYINNLKKQGIRINTFAGKECASAYIKLFLLGEERVIEDFTEFMIHNPWGKVEGDAEYVESYSKLLKKIETDLLSFYADQTGTSKEALKPLMKSETVLTPEQAVEFGFATSIGRKIELKAVAFSKKFNQNKVEMPEETLTKKDAEGFIEKLLDGIRNLGKSKTLNLKMVSDANGTELSFTELEEDDTPSVGDVATVDGSPADGEYVMPSGETYVFTSGELTEIKPVEGDDDPEELSALKEQVSDLKGQLDEKTEEVTALKKENETLKKEASENTKAIKNLEKGLMAVKRSISSDFETEEKGRKDKSQNRGTRKVWKDKKD